MSDAEVKWKFNKSGAKAPSESERDSPLVVVGRCNKTQMERRKQGSARRRLMGMRHRYP